MDANKALPSNCCLLGRMYFTCRLSGDSSAGIANLAVGGGRTGWQVVPIRDHLRLMGCMVMQVGTCRVYTLINTYKPVFFHPHSGSGLTALGYWLFCRFLHQNQVGDGHSAARGLQGQGSVFPTDQHFVPSCAWHGIEGLLAFLLGHSFPGAFSLPPITYSFLE